MKKMISIFRKISFKVAIGFIICGMGSFVFINCAKQQTAETILEKAIAAHGGFEKSKLFKKITYLKTTYLYDSIGNATRTIEREITHEWKPLRTLMEWNEGDARFKVEWHKNKLNAYKNGRLATDTMDTLALRRSLEAAFYVFWQPFKLLDKGTTVELVGLTTLLGKTEEEVFDLKITYPKDSRGHVWHYYVDVQTFLLRATEVTHDGRTSIIFNDSIEKMTGLQLNKKRSSYRIKKDTIAQLLAQYDYRILGFEKLDP